MIAKSNSIILQDNERFLNSNQITIKILNKINFFKEKLYLKFQVLS